MYINSFEFHNYCKRSWEIYLFIVVISFYAFYDFFRPGQMAEEKITDTGLRSEESE